MLYFIIQIKITISKAIYHAGQCPEMLDISLRKRVWMGLKKSNGHGQTKDIIYVLLQYEKQTHLNYYNV